MEDEYLVALMYEEDEAHVKRLLNRQRIRTMRDLADPFSVDEITFIKLYRLPPHGALNLVRYLSVETELHQGDIPLHVKVLSSLNFYGQGCYQTSVGRDSMLTLSQPAVSRCLHAVTKAIIAHLLPLHLKFPSTTEQIKAVKEGFLNLGFPNTIGAVDGTHIAIIAPPDTASSTPPKLFYNRKGYYSINAQVTCDSNGKIVHVNPNFPGSTHDAAIWSSSNLNQMLREKYVAGVRDQWVIGDKGYPLVPWLMTPYSDAPEDSPAFKYNMAHAKARNAVELCFGKLKNRFRCLLKHRVLHYKPDMAAKILLACCTLHNMFLNHWTDEFGPCEVQDRHQPTEVVAESQTDFCREGQTTRAHITEVYFNSNVAAM